MEGKLTATHDEYDVRGPSTSDLDRFFSGFSDRKTHQASTTPPVDFRTVFGHEASLRYSESRNADHPPPHSGGTSPAMVSHHQPLPMAYSFAPIPGARQHKRPARRYEEIERMYNCGWNGCGRAYGTVRSIRRKCMAPALSIGTSSTTHDICQNPLLRSSGLSKRRSSGRIGTKT
jgi:hypothetical protein